MGRRGVDLGTQERKQLSAPARNAAARHALAGDVLTLGSPAPCSSAGAPRRRRFLDFADGPIEDLGPVEVSRGGAAEPAPRGGNPEAAAELRVLAQRRVAQARQAFNGLIGVARHAVDAFAGQAESAGHHARTISEQAMTFAVKDIAISFDFAHRFARARDVHEVMQLQAEYLRAQVRLLAEPLAQRDDRATRKAGPVSTTSPVRKRRARD